MKFAIRRADTTNDAIYRKRYAHVMKSRYAGWQRWIWFHLERGNASCNCEHAQFFVFVVTLHLVPHFSHKLKLQLIFFKFCKVDLWLTLTCYNVAVFPKWGNGLSCPIHTGETVLTHQTIITGQQFAQLVERGAKHFKENLKEINDLNVFPIPDGDTGDNMYMTLCGGLQSIQQTASTSISAKAER